MRTVFLSMLLVMYTLSVHAQEKVHPDNPQGETANTPNNRIQQPACTAVPCNCCPPEKTASQSAKQTPQAESPQSKPWLTHGELVMSILTGIYVLISFFGLLAIHEQASMAQQNIQSVIDAGRTWVTVMPLHWSPELRATWEPGDPQVPSDQMRAEVHLFHARIQNAGNSVAQIDEVSVKYVYIEEGISRLPETPVYGRISPQNGYLLIPKDEYWATERLGNFDTATTDESRSKGTENGLLKKSQIANLEDGSDSLYAYGFVRYRDVFGKHRETRFGYVYEFPQWYQPELGKARFKHDGPEQYNRAT
jgi:hypothetical protein